MKKFKLLCKQINRFNRLRDARLREIENTSWKVLAYGIYARVVDVSEIEQVSAQRVRFLIQKQRVRKYRTKHFPCGIVFII